MAIKAMAAGDVDSGMEVLACNDHSATGLLRSIARAEADPRWGAVVTHPAFGPAWILARCEAVFWGAAGGTESADLWRRVVARWGRSGENASR